MKRSIIVDNNSVLKTDTPNKMQVEVSKTQKAYEVGLSTGLFIVPKILSYDFKTGKAELEYLQDLISIKKLIITNQATGLLFEDIGKALAFIHRDLKLKEEMKTYLPKCLDFNNDNVFLHGDFNTTNVLFSKKDNRLVVLDWQMTEVFDGKATYGSRYFDISWFINSVFYVPCFHFFKPFEKYIKYFIKGYSENSNGCFTENIYHEYLLKYTNLRYKKRRNERNWKGHILYTPMDYLLLNYINRTSKL